MDEDNDDAWDSLCKASDFVLETSHLSLLRNVLQMMQLNKLKTTLEISKSTIHLCCKDHHVVQVVDLHPANMGRYWPPQKSMACTISCSKLVTFLRAHIKKETAYVYKPTDRSELCLDIVDENSIVSCMNVPLDLEDTVMYVDEDDRFDVDSVHLNINLSHSKWRYALILVISYTLYL